jgi:hypothetical protein
MNTLTLIASTILVLALQLICNKCKAQATPDRILIELCDMMAKDQADRTSDVALTYAQEMEVKHRDSLRFVRLMDIVAQYGVPPKSEFERVKCSFSPIVILLHNIDLVVKPEHKAALIKQVELGNLEPWALGSALDRYYIMFENKSLYGAYPQKDPCLQDLELVNKNRAEVKLPPLKEERFVDCEE